MSLSLPNITFFIQLALFLGTVFVLNRFVFSSLLLVLDERKKKGAETSSEADKLAGKTSEVISQYDNKRAGYRAQRHEKLEILKKEIQADQNKKIEHTRRAVMELFAKSQHDLQSKVKATQKELKQEVEQMAKAVTEKFVSV